MPRSRPAPVEGWAARDVVRHLVEWFPEFLTSATGLVLARGPAPATELTIRMASDSTGQT